MSKHQKALQRLCAKPIPADITWDELSSVLKHLGYKLLKGNGSRRKFHHSGKDALIICHEPHPQPHVDKGCLADIVEHLKANGFLEESDNGHS